MKLVENILKPVKYLLDNMTFKDLLIICLSFLTVYFLFSARHYRNSSKEMTVIYKDTVSSYKNKLKEEYIAKNMYIQTIEQLKENNDELYNEIKSLKDNPVIITKTKLQVKLDTVYMENKSVDEYSKNDTTFYDLNWSTVHPQGFYKVSGTTTVNPYDIYNFKSRINELTLPVNLSLDVIEKDNHFQIIGKSDNPYVVISDYNSVFIDPSKSKLIKKQLPKKKWIIGPQFGYGLTKDMHLSPYIGLGVTYNLFGF